MGGDGQGQQHVREVAMNTLHHDGRCFGAKLFENLFEILHVAIAERLPSAWIAIGQVVVDNAVVCVHGQRFVSGIYCIALLLEMGWTGLAPLRILIHDGPDARRHAVVVARCSKNDNVFRKDALFFNGPFSRKLARGISSFRARHHGRAPVVAKPFAKRLYNEGVIAGVSHKVGESHYEQGLLALCI